MDNSHPAGPAAHRWGPDRRLRWVCLAIAAGCAVWYLLDRNPENRLVAVVLAVAGLAGALVLQRMQVRLAADAQGLTVTGPLRSRSIAWSQIATITTPRTGRFGRRGTSLEIDVRVARGPEYGLGYDAAPGGDAADGPHPAAETELLAFGAFELGTDPASVGRALARLRP